MQKVFSFSIPEWDEEAREAVENLKAKSKRTGVSFSHLIAELIKGSYSGKG